MPQAQPDSDSEYLTAAQVRHRFGDASDMWLTRRIAASGFPAPVFLGTKIRYFRLAEVMAWERAMIQRGCDAAQNPPPRRKAVP